MQKTQHKHWHSRGYLPHCDTPGLLQAVTFRLADSLPAEALLNLQQEATNDVEKRKRIEALLDSTQTPVPRLFAFVTVTPVIILF